MFVGLFMLKYQNMSDVRDTEQFEKWTSTIGTPKLGVLIEVLQGTNEVTYWYIIMYSFRNSLKSTDSLDLCLTNLLTSIAIKCMSGQDARH